MEKVKGITEEVLAGIMESHMDQFDGGFNHLGAAEDIMKLIDNIHGTAEERKKIFNEHFHLKMDRH